LHRQVFCLAIDGSTVRHSFALTVVALSLAAASTLALDGWSGNESKNLLRNAVSFFLVVISASACLRFALQSRGSDALDGKIAGGGW
jgi:hypothetical protein